MKFSSDFECGNGEDFRQTGPLRWTLRARGDRAGYDRYFHFRIEAEAGEEGTAQFEVLPDPAIQPVGPEEATRGLPGVLWRRRGLDGPWERVPAGSFEATARKVAIRQPVAPGEVWCLAEVCPLPYSDIARHVQDLPTHCPHVRTINLGQTPEGRPLIVARVSDPAVPEYEKGRVFILAGQHGTEFAGSFAAKGALDFLASRLPQAAALRRRYLFDIMLCANPDGNAHGMACFNSEGKDQLCAFRDAAQDAQPATAEAALIWKYLNLEAPDFILNFHAYAHPRAFGDPPFEGIYVSDPDRLTNPERRLHQHVLNHALFYLTRGGSQHRRPCPTHTDTLEESAALAWNSLSALYQVQAEEGPHNNLLTGVSVLQTVIDTLELAQAEEGGL